MTHNGTATLTNCTISGNSVNAPFFGEGAGVSLYGTAITLTDCSISGNTATGELVTGGGAFIAGTMNTLTDCKITGNSTTGTTGGLDLSFGTAATLNGCTISGNTAYDRGGLANYGTVTLNNCSISGNATTSPYAGGGGVGDFGTATLNGCTISGNSAGASAGGLYAGFGGSAATLLPTARSAVTPPAATEAAWPTPPAVRRR